MLNRASIFANHNNNKKIPMKTLCLSSNVVQTDKTFENNYKTKKNWHKGRAMANQNKKYLAKFSSYFCEFLWKPIEPINFTEWYEERKRFPIRIELAGSKNAEKNDLRNNLRTSKKNHRVELIHILATKTATQKKIVDDVTRTFSLLHLPTSREKSIFKYRLISFIVVEHVSETLDLGRQPQSMGKWGFYRTI